MFYSLANVHPFMHCNKRTAWGTAMIFLEDNGMRNFLGYFTHRYDEIIQVTRDSQAKGRTEALIPESQFISWLESLEKDYKDMVSRKVQPKAHPEGYIDVIPDKFKTNDKIVTDGIQDEGGEMDKVKEIISRRLVISRKRPKRVKKTQTKKIKRFVSQHKKLWKGMSKY